MEKNKKLYIIISYTGTILSRIVRLCTKDKYCHASISLDKDLEEMYSFGRKNPYVAFIGALVHESPKWGTFKRFKNTYCRIVSINVTSKQYNKVKELIYDMYEHKKDYKFNVIGLIGVKMNKKIQKPNHYYCAEFVKHILDEAELGLELPLLIKPSDFMNIESDLIYEGLLREYNQ